MKYAQDRLDVLNKIAEYEKNGWFDKDVEDDPPTIPLDYKKVDYIGKKLSTRISSNVANHLAICHFEQMIRRKKLIIKEIKGSENLKNINSGAIITCNHFNANDNYAVYKALKPLLKKKNLYKVIREGNYTSFPGFYGYLFRHCNTLPLSSSIKGLSMLMKAVNELLSRGEKILIYPEQGMWWNYRKPRPLKDGAFIMASRNMVPVIPIFITMNDGNITDASTGFPVQEYTVNILPPIFPNDLKSQKENAIIMKAQNYTAWKNTYENVYGTELRYQ